MPRTSVKPRSSAARVAGVSVIRKRGLRYDTVEASDQAAAEAEAVVRFGLTHEERQRLVIRESR
jgi:hypothetical protein